MGVEVQSTADDAAASRELHVAGVVVYARPDWCDCIARTIGMLPGAQVHAMTTDGRMVVTLEGMHSSSVEEQLSAINALPGILSSALVYQHHEDIDSLQEESVDEAHPSRIH
ncbi:chaperone NapD [Paraburkholderia sp. MMS20-SJTN17]|uniref:Chaperone NapD n=1 Tax=Paraburkholderia translucens TaxID=2886945 RepID=A0ABS8KLY1_9BURK|nr:chaperone NapD [Paraburkholderia sp. MMS20-SJTN17]MCC8405387.1 chaperone NapD [Paraburkholderia sp. MMS20-SJTN17]